MYGTPSLLIDVQRQRRICVSLNASNPCTNNQHDRSHHSPIPPQTLGGALSARGGQMAVTTTTVTQNRAVRGGGLWAQASRLNVTRSRFVGNKASEAGAGAVFTGATVAYEMRCGLLWVVALVLV
jgi:hypothetical protein